MTTENNKLIAEFIGLTYRTKKDYQGWYKDSSFTDRICSFDGLKFHTDWNWLMQVVEKIEKEHEFNTKLWYNRTRKDYQMQLFYTDFEKDIIVNSKSKIEAVYNACIEFIKWYNENKI
jgi:hypothetical protein